MATKTKGNKQMATKTNCRAIKQFIDTNYPELKLKFSINKLESCGWPVKWISKDKYVSAFPQYNGKPGFRISSRFHTENITSKTATKIDDLDQAIRAAAKHFSFKCSPIIINRIDTTYYRYWVFTEK